MKTNTPQLNTTAIPSEEVCHTEHPSRHSGLDPESRKVPKLRFPEFTDEWQEKKLGGILRKFKLGGNYENSDRPNDFPLIKMGNLGRGNIVLNKIEYIKDGQSIDQKDLIRQNDIFFNTRNTLELVGKVAIWRNELPKAYFNSNLMRLTFSCNSFMNYFLNSYKGLKSLKRLATGTTSVAAIYTRDLLRIKLLLPEVEEQEKIADFLTAVDEKIGKLEEKKKAFEKYKKGIMQAIFPTCHPELVSGSPNPRLRFRKSDGSNYPDWEEKKLGDLLNYEQPTKYIVESTEYNEQFRTPVLTAGKTFILGYTNESDNIFKDLPVVIFDDFTTTSQFVNFPFKVKSSAMKILKAKSGSNIRFVFESMQKIKYEVGGHGRHWISIFSNMKIQTPSKEEQEKIAEFLTSLDNKVDLINKELEQAKLFKKSLLQQMFV